MRLGVAPLASLGREVRLGVATTLVAAAEAGVLGGRIGRQRIAARPAAALVALLRRQRRLRAAPPAGHRQRVVDGRRLARETRELGRHLLAGAAATLGRDLRPRVPPTLVVNLQLIHVD